MDTNDGEANERPHATIRRGILIKEAESNVPQDPRHNIGSKEFETYGQQEPTNKMGIQSESKGQLEPRNGYRSPETRDVSFKLATPVPTETPGSRDYDSSRQSRNSMLTPGDKDMYKGRFTGKSTLKNKAKNPFGYVLLFTVCLSI